jgi:hypothetical protein
MDQRTVRMPEEELYETIRQRSEKLRERSPWRRSYGLDRNYQERFNMPLKDKDRLKKVAGLQMVPTPEDQARMSAIILQLAEPLLKQYGKASERAEALIMLVIAGWNKSMVPPDKLSLVEKDLIDGFVPKDGSAEAVGVALEVMELVADRRKKLFPDLRKIIVDYDLVISDGCLTLHVTSAPIPDLGGGTGEQGVKHSQSKG